MKIMYFENDSVEIETEILDNGNVKIIVESYDSITSFEVSYSDFERMIEDGVVDIIDEEDYEDDYCECPYCRIEEQIETLNLYLEEALSECDFEEIKYITESIKNLMEIREML